MFGISSKSDFFDRLETHFLRLFWPTDAPQEMQELRFEEKRANGLYELLSLEQESFFQS